MVICYGIVWSWIPLMYCGHPIIGLIAIMIAAPAGFWVINRRYKTELREINERHAVRMKEIDERHAVRMKEIDELYALPPLQRMNDERSN